MLTKFWSKLRNFLYYYKAERDGALVFIFILLLCYIGFYAYQHWTEKSVDNRAFFDRVDSIEQAMQPKQIAREYFVFNPNVADSSTLLSLGFSTKQIRNLLNYRKAGGHFYKREDFKKLYFVNDSIYRIYEPYIRISERNSNASKRINKDVSTRHQQATAKKKDSLFVFDPNEISKREWLLLGVSEKLTNTILNYLSKGGHFWKKEDLQKIYGMSEREYLKLAPYVEIATKPKRQKRKTIDTVKYDLNTINEEDLQKIRVSKSMAHKFVKYREKLGGYARFSQLLEIYNVREWDLKQLRAYCKIQSGVKQININTAAAKDLYQHPYLDFRDAQAIVRYRKRKGMYMDIERLKTSKILTNETFEKVKFYLKVKN